MKREIEKCGVNAYISNYTPRRNEYEKGLKYRLIVDDTPTGYLFSTIKEAKEFFCINYFIWI